MAQITTKEKIEVMQAFLDGKDVQRKDIQRKLSLNGDGWSDFTDEPMWNWLEFNYRIKPEYRPYNKVSGDWLGRFIRTKYYAKSATQIAGIYMTNTLLISGVGVCNLGFLYENFTWADGSPCGEVVE
jgi:hypothetical protein